jgi:hypothetical protein
LAVVDYHKLASPYFPQPLPVQREPKLPNDKPSISYPTGISQDEMGKILDKLKDATKRILETFVLEQSPKEINIMARQRKQLITELTNGNLHPEVWKPSFEHIATLLKTNSLQKFLKATE